MGIKTNHMIENESIFRTWDDWCLIKLKELGKSSLRQWATAMGYKQPGSMIKLTQRLEINGKLIVDKSSGKQQHYNYEVKDDVFFKVSIIDKYICDICGRVCFNKRSLSSHRWWHDDRKRELLSKKIKSKWKDPTSKYNSPEYRNKISELKKGDNHPRGMLNKHHTEEAKKKIGDGNRGEKNGMYKTKRKIREAKTGKTPIKKIVITPDIKEAQNKLVKILTDMWFDLNAYIEYFTKYLKNHNIITIESMTSDYIKDNGINIQNHNDIRNSFISLVEEYTKTNILSLENNSRIFYKVNGVVS